MKELKQRRERSVANLDGPLAVCGRRIEAGVKWGGEGSFTVREHSATFFN